MNGGTVQDMCGARRLFNTFFQLQAQAKAKTEAVCVYFGAAGGGCCAVRTGRCLYAVSSYAPIFKRFTPVRLLCVRYLLIDTNVITGKYFIHFKHGGEHCVMEPN